jgi:inositol 1,4,5-triphosphate receptor type 1
MSLTHTVRSILHQPHASSSYSPSTFVVISFEICVANRYKLNKKYRKLLAKSEEDPDNLGLKTQASQAQVCRVIAVLFRQRSICFNQIAAEAENEDNVAEQKRQQGKKVQYGQIVQVKILNNQRK